MPVTKVRSVWSSGGLVFHPRVPAEVPSTMIQVGNTSGVDLAGGVTAVYGWIKHGTTAMTGTARGIRGNASVLVASTGTAVGVDGRAANGTSTTAGDGVNLTKAIGVSALVAGVGISGPAVIASAYGVYAQLDIDAANLTVSDARGLYVNVQSGNSAANTLTACNLAYLEYESVVGTAPAINSAIKIATVGGNSGINCLIDASTAKLKAYTGNVVLLMSFMDSAGTKNYLVHDADSATVVAVTTSAPS